MSWSAACGLVTERKRILVSMEQFERETTLAADITVASCQGKDAGTRTLQDLHCDV